MIKGSLIIFIFSLILTAGCGPDEAPLATRRRRPPVQEEAEPPREILQPVHTYGGDNYRCPFSPDPVRVAADPGRELRAEEINFASLKITGMVTGSRSSYAMLSGPQGDYIVKDGRLLDDNNKKVSGVAAVIQEDKITFLTRDGTFEVEPPLW